MQQYGRLQIFTDTQKITYENVISVLQKAFPIHVENANKCTYLLNYEKGIQPLKRKEEKKYRKDIDFHICDNIANEITTFKTSFNWGNPITLIQRGEIDSGTQTESEAIALLNECYDAEGIKKKTQELARFVEICGIGYTYVDINTDYEDGDSYFKVDVIDPRYAFVIRSTYYPDHRIIASVMFRQDEKRNRWFTCFTKDTRFDIKNLQTIENGQIIKDREIWQHETRSGELNPLRRIPLIEWIRNHDRMGCFERQIDDMDALNLLVSDFMNGVDQNIQCIWRTNDVEFPKQIVKGEDGSETEVVQKPKDGDWMQTFTTPDGKTPTVEALTLDYDYNGMQNQMAYRVARIKSKCNVPLTSDGVSNATGIAVSDATGWTNAEIEASMQDQIKEGCKIEEVKVVLAAIKLSPYIEPNNPLLNLRSKDTTPSIKRQKNYELTTKANFASTMLKLGYDGLHVTKEMNLFGDPAQVWEDSKEMIIAIQKSQITDANSETAETTSGNDRLSQYYNSPRIDGMATEQKSISN